MVLGIGEGKLELALNGNTFSPGQAITGRAKLTLNEPLLARELRVEFYGLVKRGKHADRIHEVRQQLSHERTFRSGESFEFSLAIPADAISAGHATGILGSLSQAFAPRPDWFVEASLDMPNKFDINAKTQVILISRPLGGV